MEDTYIRTSHPTLFSRRRIEEDETLKGSVERIPSWLETASQRDILISKHIIHCSYH
jgi:hypothetical protein